MHQYSAVANYVLPADIGNHTFHLAGVAPAREIPSVHDDTGRAERRDHHYHPEHTLSQTEHSQDGTLGQEVLHPSSAEIAFNAGAK